MKVVAIIQARMGSTRLPGKVMRRLEGRPMIGHVVERALRIDGVDQVVVATTTHPEDEPLVRFLSETTDILVYRGPENDVLSRYVGAAEEAGAGVIVRLTADCPLLCPSVSTRVVREFLAERGSWDYASNTLRRTYPRGLDTEVFSHEILLRASREAILESDREHVTPFVWRQPELFRLRNIADQNDRSDLRLTVDFEPDLVLASRIYATCHPENAAFDYAEILACLEAHPDWVRDNRLAVEER